MRIYPSNKLCNLACEVWELWADGAVDGGGGVGVEGEGMSAVGAKEEGTPTALDLVFLSPGKLSVWLFTFQHFFLI